MRHVLRPWIATVASILLGCGAMACGAAAGGADSPAAGSDGGLGIAGVDPDELTARERNEWTAFVAELPAPCPNVDATLKQCVQERRDCGGCVPAVRFLFSQVRRGKTAMQVAAAYQLRYAPGALHEIELADAPTKGESEPVVRIVEWADFECSACAALAPLVDRKLKMFPDHLGLVFKHYPIARHENSEPAARGGVAAAQQGKFWRLHDLMFLNQHQLAGEGVPRLARQAGLDMTRFEQDWTSPQTHERVRQDVRQADALGLTGTPMIFINGRHFDYEHFSVLDDLDEWIQQEIESKTGKLVEPREVTADTWPDPQPVGAPSEGSAP